jgi:hypothetical protein
MTPAYRARIELAILIPSTREATSIAATTQRIAGNNAKIIVESDEISLISLMSTGTYVIWPPSITDRIISANIGP